MSATRRIAWSLMVLLVSVQISAGAQQQADQTASEAYLKYRAVFDKAKKLEELFPYVTKDVRAQMEATPADERAQMFAMVKEMRQMKSFKIVKETKTADGVTLSVEGVGMDKETMTGQVQVVKEGGAWKIGKESWSSKG